MATSQTRKPEEATEQKTEEQPITAAPASLDAPSGKFVKHLPHELFSARVIRKADWASIGIHDQEAVEWNEGNDFQLPVELFSDGALKYLTDRDDGFKIVG